jgi:glycosyltransferase involved in cell wall biosynthesis
MAMHVVFVSYYSFACNSGGHIACLGNALMQHGARVTVFVPFDPSSATLHGAVNFACREFSEREAWLAAEQPDPEQTLIVAWTPRENVRLFVGTLRERLRCPYLVHLEDNEEVLTAANLGLSRDALRQLPPAELDRRLSVDDRLAHPGRFPRFIAGSAGITALADSLRNFAPAGHKHCVFWPGYNPAFFGPRPVDYPGRRALGIADDTTVLVYPGNVHSANVAEVRSLYLATCILNRQGMKTLLIRTGEDYVPVLDHTLHEAACHYISLGKLASQAGVAATLALADVLVQPGHAGLFNDYRFPSKLPEFFALGRPVLLPASNLGHYVRPGLDAIVLQRGDALDIAAALRSLVPDTDRRQRLAASAREFAGRHFQWPEIAGRLAGYYSSFLSDSR